MRLIAFILHLFWLAVPGHAQTVYIEGTIEDVLDNNRAVSGALVMTMPPTQEVCTDRNGRYRIAFQSPRQARTVDIYAFKSGYSQDIHRPMRSCDLASRPRAARVI